jgi:hypothetical protein
VSFLGPVHLHPDVLIDARQLTVAPTEEPLLHDDEELVGLEPGQEVSHPLVVAAAREVLALRVEQRFLHGPLLATVATMVRPLRHRALDRVTHEVDQPDPRHDGGHPGWHIRVVR